MARIRTVKPALFRHEELYQLEVETGLPIRIAWVGLFTVADREGRFRWKPNELKLDVLPFDPIDFSRVLHALVTRGFLVRYASEGREFGFIPTFRDHQVINNKEMASELPDPRASTSKIHEIDNACATREPRVANAIATPLFPDQGEGKGREGNMEKEGKGTSSPLRVPAAPPKIPEGPTLGSQIFDAYSSALKDFVLASQGEIIEVPRNAKNATHCKQIGERIGKDAVEVVRFFVGHPDQFYALRGYPLDLLVRDAESMHIQWQTKKPMTRAKAKSFERNQNTRRQLNEVDAEIAQLMSTRKPDGPA